MILSGGVPDGIMRRSGTVRERTVRERMTREAACPPLPARPSWTWRTLWVRLRRPLRSSLSRRLLVLTILFVMLSEVLIFVPSVANFRKTRLEQNLAAAQIAALALEATPDNMVSPMLRQELLRNAQVFAVALHRDAGRRLVLSEEMPPAIDAHYDLRTAMAPRLILDAFVTLAAARPRVIEVIGYPRFGAGESISVIMDETPLRLAMWRYGIDIFWLSIAISVMTACLVFLSLHIVFVRPMRRITQNMVAFRRNPEDARRVIVPSSREDELGTAERELSLMQEEIRETLNQKARLAALGAAVSKISHDLRNILANAQLISDRLGAVDDPTVQHLAPRLFASIDRAIALCANTLRFGRADEKPPHRVRFPLALLVDEVGLVAGLPEDGRIRWLNEVPGDMLIDADPEHMFRILLNMGRNAVQALIDGRRGMGEIRIAATEVEGHVHVVMSDTGPGLPEKARAHLFEAFAGSARAGGTGLGLAIADELARIHGGGIALLATGEGGTSFRICIPRGESLTGCADTGLSAAARDAAANGSAS